MFRPVPIAPGAWFVTGPTGRIAAGPFDTAWKAHAWAGRANRALGTVA